MTFIPDKPEHRRFAFCNLNSTQYKTYARQYSKAKAGGIRCVYTWMSGVEVVGVVTDVGKSIVIDYGKRKFAAFCFECVEDSTNLAFIPIDFALFGQPIPLGASNRFNLFSNHTDFLGI